MHVTLELLMETEIFELDDGIRAEALAESACGRVYTWKTIGKHNWLEHGYSIVDAAGLVVLPRSLPDTIRMSDDAGEEGDIVCEIE